MKFINLLRSIALLTVVAAISASCDKLHDNPSFSSENLLLGSWHDYAIQDSITVFERVSALKSDEYGFTIKDDHSFLEHKNIGWCGTPPIVYGDYTGNWDTQNSVLNVSVPFWGGMVDYHWKIVSLDEKFLKIVRLP